MLNVNHLTGFGVSETAAAGYRYLRLYISSSDATTVQISEINWVDSAVDYPTQTMTSNTAPSPLIASASSELDSTYAAWKAMDNTFITRWVNSPGAIPSWHTIDLGGVITIAATAIVITPTNTSAELPTAFTCYGSNTGAFAGEETTLGTFSPGTSGWTSGVRRTFTF